MEPIISVRGLGKSYQIQTGERKPYRTLRDDLADFGKGLLKGQWDNSKTEEFWALKDVDFDIYPGEVVGIVGRNGAGKSTLLKILSRIIQPTTGEATLYGRVASLLEVGTGFHPELTGRENIFMSGAVLGMKHTEIKKKFNEIVDFAEINKFIDIPVKRYSSGMFVRLAFAVGAHLESEILIIDEVLAVGDIKFQKKCIQKIDEVSKRSNGAIILVSHDMKVIKNSCKTSILLEDGKIKKIGSCEEIIKKYFDLSHNKTSFKAWSIDSAPGNKIVKLISIRTINKNGITTENFKISEPVGIQINYRVLIPGEILWQGYNFYNEEGINIFDSHNVNMHWYNEPHQEGEFISTAWIPGNLLAEGSIIVSCAIFNHAKHEVYLHEKDVIIFNVIDTFETNTARGESIGVFPGVVRPLLKWENQKING
jgi:lipopolysaccharide transport system ATP-binding protein